MATIPEVEKTKETLLEIFETCWPWKAVKASDIGKEPTKKDRVQRMAKFLQEKKIEGTFEPARWDEYILAISKHEPCPICGYAMEQYGLATRSINASSWSCRASKWHTTAMDGAKMQITNMVKHIEDEGERNAEAKKYDQVTLACDSLCVHSLPTSMCNDPECRTQALESARRSEANYRKYCEDIGAFVPA